MSAVKDERWVGSANDTGSGERSIFKPTRNAVIIALFVEVINIVAAATSQLSERRRGPLIIPCAASNKIMRKEESDLSL